jgi:hypothetical protein
MNIKTRVKRNCLLFAVLTVILNTLAFYFLAEPVLYKGYVLPKQELREHSSFMMGDSHAGVIRQQDLDRLNTTNFAFNSESYFDVYNKLHYLSDRFRVDTLYLCVDNHTLSMYRQSWTNRARSIYFSDFKHYTDYYNISRRDYILKKYLYFRFPLFDTSHSKVLKEKIGSVLRGEKPGNYDTYDFSKVAVERRIERSRQRISTQFPEEPASVLLTGCLEEIISLCRAEEIVLIGVKFPLTREFYEELGDRSYKADSIFELHHLPVLDYSRVYLDSISYFRDQDHLNHKGSAKFVRLMESDIR